MPGATQWGWCGCKKQEATRSGIGLRLGWLCRGGVVGRWIDIRWLIIQMMHSQRQKDCKQRQRVAIYVYFGQEV